MYKKVIIAAISAALFLGLSLSDFIKCAAAESDTTSITRGATDYYYTPVNYEIYNQRGRTHMKEKTFTTGFDVTLHVGFFEFTLSHKQSGTYKVYSYIADIEVTAKKTDAIGHDLGTVTFTYNGYTLYDYYPV